MPGIQLHDSSYQDKLPELKTATVIGITVAIAGNVLISLALNLQKLAHKRQDAEKNGRTKEQDTNTTNGNPHTQLTPNLNEADESCASQSASNNSEALWLSDPERQPLLVSRHELAYAPASSSGQTSLPQKFKRTFISKLLGPSDDSIPESGSPEFTSLIVPVDVLNPEALVDGHRRENIDTSHRKRQLEEDEEEEGNETDYLKSKLWWCGFLLMNIGEIGNFISYAWAPASIVAPLGTFALIANCAFAPVLLGERFRKRDIFGVLVAIVGAITVVFSTNASNARLDPDALMKAIKKVSFIIYASVYLAGIIILCLLSEGPVGRRLVFVDTGLCGLFGGFTVLSTKAVSTLLTMEWITMFTEPITYPVIAVLLATGVGQIRYLNRALMRFDSKTVIPIQFVMFNLSAIVGSAILYGDFEKATFHQIVTFLYGCSATFAGVFIIASTSSTTDEEDLVNDANGHFNLDGPGSPVREEAPFSVGSLGRRRGATLILPNSPSSPLLRRKQSTQVIGLSPAHPLLLVHTPPRDFPLRDLDPEVQTPESSHRRRAMTWFPEQQGERPGSARRPREQSIGHDRKPQSLDRSSQRDTSSEFHRTS